MSQLTIIITPKLILPTIPAYNIIIYTLKSIKNSK